MEWTYLIERNRIVEYLSQFPYLLKVSTLTHALSDSKKFSKSKNHQSMNKYKDLKLWVFQQIEGLAQIVSKVRGPGFTS